MHTSDHLDQGTNDDEMMMMVATLIEIDNIILSKYYDLHSKILYIQIISETKLPSRWPFSFPYPPSCP